MRTPGPRIPLSIVRWACRRPERYDYAPIIFLLDSRSPRGILFLLSSVANVILTFFGETEPVEWKASVLLTEAQETTMVLFVAAPAAVYRCSSACSQTWYTSFISSKKDYFLVLFGDDAGPFTGILPSERSSCLPGFLGDGFDRGFPPPFFSFESDIIFLL